MKKFAVLAGALALVLSACGAQTPDQTRLYWELVDAAVEEAQAQGIELINLQPETIALIQGSCIAGATGARVAVGSFAPTSENIALVLDRAPEHVRGACRVALNILAAAPETAPVPVEKPAAE